MLTIQDAAPPVVPDSTSALAPSGPISLESLKSASFVALAEIFASPTVDHREKRLAVHVFFKYLAIVEARQLAPPAAADRVTSAPAPSAHPAAPKLPARPIAPPSPATQASDNRPRVAAQPPPAAPRQLATPPLPRAATCSPPISPPSSTPASPLSTSPTAAITPQPAAPIVPINPPSPAAILRARAGIAPNPSHDPTAPHAGVNFHPKVHARPHLIPRAPPMRILRAAPPASFHHLAAAA